MDRTKPMRIAYLNADRGIPILGDKGASVHVREFITALAGWDNEVTLFCAQRGSGNPSPPAQIVELAPSNTRGEIDRLRIPHSDSDRTLRRELAGLAYDRTLCRRVLAKINETENPPQLLYERYALFHRSGIDIAAALHIPRALEVNAPLVEEQERFRGLRLKQIAERIETQTFTAAHHIIAVSDAVRDHVLTRGVSPERVSVFANGVDTTRFHPGVDGTDVRTRYGLGDRPVIGFVGSFKPWHGLDFLLDGFIDVLRHHPSAALFAVGDGPGLNDMRTRAMQSGVADSVVFSGRIAYADVPHYLAAMDITAAPYPAQSDFYFSPLKVVESLAAGRPVVAPRIGQLTTLLHDGETGLLFTPGDKSEFSAAIVTLLNDRRNLRSMTHKARTAAEANFSWSGIARRVLDIMNVSRYMDHVS